MNFVEPIRDRNKIAQIKNLLRGKVRFRDLLLFVVGINSALRISDLLQLQILHFVDEQGHVRQRFWIKEQKRGKRQEVVINESIREAWEEYLAAYPGIGEKPENFVFFNPKTNDYSHPIKRGQSWKFITSICREVGLRGNFGTHSLRKTWGYHEGIRSERQLMETVNVNLAHRWFIGYELTGAVPDHIINGLGRNNFLYEGENNDR